MAVLYSCDRCDETSKKYMFSLMAVGYTEPMLLCDECRKSLVEWFMAPVSNDHYWFADPEKEKPVWVEL